MISLDVTKNFVQGVHEIEPISELLKDFLYNFTVEFYFRSISRTLNWIVHKYEDVHKLCK